ncbi:Aminoacyl-tRNA synthetase [uncultured virus]|nr:Aminoacyl-tRNA synthetase [uncultured virus]
MHIAQAVTKVITANACVHAGCDYVILLADYFASLNNKLDGDIAQIRSCGEAMIDTWRALGIDSRVRFIWSSDMVHSPKYLNRVIDIAKVTTIDRLKRCSTIMGRQNQDGMMSSQILYPLMQCADIFELGVDICQLGIDQRKVNMLARDYCSKAGIANKPIVISHKLISGLNGQSKMSKSDVNNAIFVDDDRCTIAAKINQETTQLAALLDYGRLVILYSGKLNHYTSTESIEADIESGALSVEAFKDILIAALDVMLSRAGRLLI